MTPKGTTEREIMIVHWPGKSTPACPEHLQKLVGLAAILGFPLTWTPAEEGATCANCDNEREKAKP